MRWFGPQGSTMLGAEVDARVGGRFHFGFTGLDGEEHNVGGVYREIVPDEELVMTWAWRSTPERESLLTISLRRDGDATMLTLMHEQFFDEAAREGHHRGWTAALDKLEAFFA